MAPSRKSVLLPTPGFPPVPINPRGGGGGVANVNDGRLGIAAGGTSGTSTSSSSRNARVIPAVVPTVVDLTEMAENKYSFETSVGTEVKDIVWELKNFKALSTMKDSFSDLRIDFEAGKSIGLPSKWNIFMRRNDDDLGIYLRLIDNPTQESEVFARFDTAIKRVTGTDYYRLCTEVVDMNEVTDWGWSCISSVPKLNLASTHVLLNDMLTIHIKFYLYSRRTVNRSSNVSLTKLQSTCQQQLSKSLQTMLDNKSLADVTLKTNDGTEFLAHKVILGAQSHVFDAMFSTDMSEKQTGVVKIEDLAGPAFRVVLKFIYTGEVDSNWANCCEEVVYAAEKYQLPLLKSFCDHTLATACTRENALDLMKLARFHNLPIATIQITEFIKTNVDGILQRL